MVPTAPRQRHRDGLNAHEQALKLQLLETNALSRRGRLATAAL